MAVEWRVRAAWRPAGVVEVMWHGAEVEYRARSFGWRWGVDELLTEARREFLGGLHPGQRTWWLLARDDMSMQDHWFCLDPMSGHCQDIQAWLEPGAREVDQTAMLNPDEPAVPSDRCWWQARLAFGRQWPVRGYVPPAARSNGIASPAGIDGLMGARLERPGPQL